MTAIHREGLIFEHAGDARVAASVTLAGVVAVLFSAAMATGPRITDDQHGVAGGTAARAGKAVRFVGAAPARRTSCDAQVWPHIEQRCLHRTDDSATTPPEKATAMPVDERQGNEKLTPLTATGATVVGRAVTPADDAEEGTHQAISAGPAASPAREVPGQQVREEASTNNDDAGEPPPTEPSHKHVHRRHAFRFHVHFGPFRF